MVFVFQRDTELRAVAYYVYLIEHHICTERSLMYFIYKGFN